MRETRHYFIFYEGNQFFLLNVNEGYMLKIDTHITFSYIKIFGCHCRSHVNEKNYQVLPKKKKQQQKTKKTHNQFLTTSCDDKEGTSDQTEHGKHIFIHCTVFPSSSVVHVFVRIEISWRKVFFVSRPETDKWK